MMIPLLLLVLAALPARASFDCSNPAACTVTCDNSNDHTDFASAIAAANQDSTISVGVGTCNLASTVSVNRRVTLAGAGVASTTISGAGAPWILINHGNTGLARVTGFHFSGSKSVALEMDGPMTQVRVDHCKFSNGVAEGINAYSGQIEGVIDNNEFSNCGRCILIIGANDTGWTTDFSTYSGGSGTGNFTAGGSHALFIEDNLFYRNNSTLGDSDTHYSQEGARTVYRYNTVDFEDWTSGVQTAFDSHGNQVYYDEVSNFRGQPIAEIYNNTFLMYESYHVIEPRSGSNLIWGNTITIANPTGGLSQVIALWEEEAFEGTGTHFEGKYDYVWPTEDMVTNTFIWNNTINGNPLTSSHVDGAANKDCCGTYSDTNFVMNINRDIWFHEPQSSGGRTYYDDRAGASGRNSDGTLVFTASGANAYYPYTPYTYPHPLRNESASGGGSRTGGGSRVGGGGRIGDE